MSHSVSKIRDSIRTNFGLSSDEIRRDKYPHLMLLTVDDAATAKTLSETLSPTTRTTESHLAKLKKNEILKREGADKTGYYKICNQP